MPEAKRYRGNGIPPYWLLQADSVAGAAFLPSLDLSKPENEQKNNHGRMHRCYARLQKKDHNRQPERSSRL